MTNPIGTPPAGAVDLTDGQAEVNLGVCAQGSSQTDTFIPNCSYTYLVKRAAPSFTYVTSQGAVSWKGGSLTGNALSFPAAGQTWLALTGLFLNASAVATPANMMVMGPGDYRFGDYWKLGVPLVLISFAVAVGLVPLIWPF